MTHRFEVWAPAASSVDVVIGDARHPMVRIEGDDDRRGWWAADVDGAGAATDYLLSVDGGDPRPDPRSAWQPSGVHGPSRVYDHDAFRWTDGDWRGGDLADQVIYELHVGTFSDAGTFDGVVERLPHLVDLGVTAIELLPVNAFPGRWGWGYDGVDLYAVHEPYGGPDGLKRLVDACHAAGLGVVIDVVYNHVGPSGNYLPVFGPYFTDTYSTPWGDAVNFDGADSDEVRRFFVDNALMWLRDYHADGLRLDAVHAYFDRSATHFLEEVSVAVDDLAARLGRPLWTIAESDLNDPRVVTDRERGGYGMHASWSDDFHHALHVALTGETSGYYADFAGGIADLATALRDVYVYGGRYSEERRRRHGRGVGDLPRTRFLGYLQDHDQVGNRAVGERSSHLMSPGLLKVGAALVLLSPFVPMLWQGEEWGASTPFQYFTDHEDPDLAEAVRQGRRREFASFGWKPEDVPDPQSEETFLRSKLRWAEVGDEPHSSVLEWHRALLRLRSSTPALRSGAPDVDVDVDESRRTVVVRRGGMEVACNLGTDPVVVASTAAEVLLASDVGIVRKGTNLSLPAESVAVSSH